MNNTTNTPNYNFNGKTILMVDDDKFAVQIAGLYLKDTGAELVSVEDGQAAVDMVKNRYFDLVLMDIKMPVMDGYDATRTIRKFNSTVPIIMHTAYNDFSGKSLSIDAGCNDQMLKPVQKMPFLNTIDKYI